MKDSKPNFQLAYEKANEILATSQIISSFPYSTTSLIKEQSNIACRKFSKAQKYNVDIEAFGSKSALIMNLDDNYIIFYNQDENPERVKFSILHEYGHKINNHAFKYSSEELYGIYEVEANYFAAQLLMPEQIIREFQKRGKRIDKSFLMDTFGVSEPAAEKRISTLYKTTWKRDLNEKEYDDIILNKYTDWINSIVPYNFEYLFLSEDDKELEREQWKNNY